MPPTSEQIALARKYEPILFFHPDERFFPVDPKRYIEFCALWRLRAPFMAKETWGEEPASAFPKTPIIAASEIATMTDSPAYPNELQGDNFLGAHIVHGVEEDRFLELASWEGSPANPDNAKVTTSSENRHSSLDRIALSYNESAGLSNSRFWYYAEILDGEALRHQPKVAAVREIDVEAFVRDKLIAPQLILYHLFYAAHEEPLEGCESEGAGDKFGSFAGEWACIAVLEQNGFPTHIGLTQRNVGTLKARDDETRIGMAVHPWRDVRLVAGRPNHPKVHVARGTHSNYLTSGTNGKHRLAPFSSETFDISRDSCGRIEDLDDVISTSEPDVPAKEALVDDEIFLAKVIGSFFFWGSLVGAIVEAFAADSFFGTFAGIAPNPKSNPEDTTASGEEFGRALVPEEVRRSELEEPVTNLVSWPTSNTRAPNGEFTSSTRRKYGFVVDRSTQIWWPPRGVGPGYRGRWGPAVTHDPKRRRSGMRTPEFWAMFIAALFEAI